MTNKKISFDVKVEVLVPAVLTYRVEAESEKKALDFIDKQHFKTFKPNLQKRIKLNAKVYTAGTVMLKHTKIYRNM